MHWPETGCWSHLTQNTPYKLMSTKKWESLCGLSNTNGGRRKGGSKKMDSAVHRKIWYDAMRLIADMFDLNWELVMLGLCSV